MEKAQRAVSPEKVAKRAYELFEQRGRTHGQDMQDWLDAEWELSMEGEITVNGTDAAERAEMAKRPAIPGDGPLAEPSFQPTNDIRYPTWQPEVRAVMMEIDPEKVREKIALAERAMAARAKELTGPDDRAELHAMEREGQDMRLAIADVLADPGVKK